MANKGEYAKNVSRPFRSSSLYPDGDYKWTRIDGRSPNVNQRRVAFNNKSTFVTNALRLLLIDGLFFFFLYPSNVLYPMLYGELYKNDKRSASERGVSNRENRSWPGKV